VETVLIIIISVLVLYLLFVFLFQWLPLALLTLKGSSARFTDEGIMIYSKVRGDLCFYKWDEIANVESRFQPPLHYPIVKLKNGKSIKLYMENINQFMKSYEECNSITEKKHHE